MIPATFTLLVAALSVNAVPIFSGFLSSRSERPAKRDLTATQLAQGTNYFFGSLYLEAECTPGQVACIGGMTATCSPEANWETSPCTGNTTCYAIPANASDETDDSLVVTCMTPDEAETALGSQDLSVDYQITTAPVNSTIVDTPDESPSDPTDELTSSDDSGDEPTSTDDSTPSFTQSLGGDVPAPTDAPTSSDDPAATCTEDPEPEITEYITVIAFPNPTNSAELTYSTVLPTETDSVSEAVPTSTDSTEDPAPTEDPTEEPAPSDPTDSSTDEAPTEDPTDSEPAPTDIPGSDANVPTDSDTDSPTCTEDPTDSYEDPASTDDTSSEEPASTDAPTDVPTATDSSSEITPTTLSIPPSVESPTADVSVVGTHFVPANPAKRGMVRKVRRS